LRVEIELPEAAESVLLEGETLTSLIEAASSLSGFPRERAGSPFGDRYPFPN